MGVKVKSRTSPPGECFTCAGRTLGGTPSPVLQCSSCGKDAHLACLKLEALPERAWFCGLCEMKQRREGTDMWGNLVSESSALAFTLKDMAARAQANNRATEKAVARAEKMEEGERRWRDERDGLRAAARFLTLKKTCAHLLPPAPPHTHTNSTPPLSDEEGKGRRRQHNSVGRRGAAAPPSPPRTIAYRRRGA